jgi:NAD(P)-dependent dehydrogenase (short-subunit alcohol dehydrogenase family)
MVKDGEPRSIVNISSTSGIYGNAGQASYALAKAGLVGLTKTVAQEWGPEYGVRANSMRPVQLLPSFETDIYPQPLLLELSKRDLRKPQQASM